MDHEPAVGLGLDAGVEVLRAEVAFDGQTDGLEGAAQVVQASGLGFATGEVQVAVRAEHLDVRRGRGGRRAPGACGCALSLPANRGRFDVDLPLGDGPFDDDDSRPDNALSSITYKSYFIHIRLRMA